MQMVEKDPWTIVSFLGNGCTNNGLGYKQISPTTGLFLNLKYVIHEEFYTKEKERKLGPGVHQFLAAVFFHLPA